MSPVRPFPLLEISLKYSPFPFHPESGWLTERVKLGEFSRILFHCISTDPHHHTGAQETAGRVKQLTVFIFQLADVTSHVTVVSIGFKYKCSNEMRHKAALLCFSRSSSVVSLLFLFQTCQSVKGWLNFVVVPEQSCYREERARGALTFDGI